MKRILLYIFAAASALLSGCEKDVKFSGSQTAPQMVLNSIIVAGSPVKVYVGRSTFFLSKEAPATLKDATVELYINGSLKEQLTGREESGGFFYYGTVIPAEGDVVKITARNAQFPDGVWGQTSIPSRPSIKSVAAGSVVPEKTIGATGRFQMLFDEQPSTTDYYWVSIKTNSDEDDDDINWDNVTYTDPVFKDETASMGSIFGNNDSKQQADSWWFDDSKISGIKAYPLSVKFYLTDMYTEGMELKFRVVFRRVDSNLYKYLVSKHQSEDDSILREPVRIHSNVSGGIGIVGSMSTAAATGGDYYVLTI